MIKKYLKIFKKNGGPGLLVGLGLGIYMGYSVQALIFGGIIGIFIIIFLNINKKEK